MKIGQEPLVAHFGGVNPNSTYTLRVVNGRRQFSALVVPSAASTTIGSTVIPQMYTAVEPTQLRVTRWRTVSADE